MSKRDKERSLTRRKERERLDSLGSMVPVVDASDSATVLSCQGGAIPIRHKRGDTGLRDNVCDDSESAPLSPNSIMAPPIKKTRARQSVRYGTVEALDFETPTDHESQVPDVPDVLSDSF